jgi:Tfp pilus assembly protein PilE
LGILAAIASVSYVGYIDSAKQTDARNGLSAIVMKQEQYIFANDAYYDSADTCTIAISTTLQTELFGSQNSLSMTDYCYYIGPLVGANAAYTAYACQLGNTGECFTLDNLNVKGSTGSSGLSW